MNVDEWFKQIRDKYSGQMQCGKGCTDCMVDTHRRLFGDWCDLNFKEEIPEAALTDLQLDYAEIDAVQEAGSAKVAAAVGLQDPRALTFIPSVIAEYPAFWRRLLT
jgi:hypothetical protein